MKEPDETDTQWSEMQRKLQRLLFDWQTKYVFVGRGKGPGGGNYRGQRLVNGKWIWIN